MRTETKTPTKVAGLRKGDTVTLTVVDTDDHGVDFLHSRRVRISHLLDVQTSRPKAVVFFGVRKSRVKQTVLLSHAKTYTVVK